MISWHAVFQKYCRRIKCRRRIFYFGHMLIKLYSVVLYAFQCLPLDWLPPMPGQGQSVTAASFFGGRSDSTKASASIAAVTA